MTCTAETDLYGCGNGYSYYYGGCCSHGLYIFWNVMLWTSLCCMCTALIVAMTMR